MSMWPLDKSSYVTFEDAIKDVFGKTSVKINYVDIFNSGFLLFSQKDPTPTITININDSFLLKMMIRRFLKCTIEHEFTHMVGKEKWSSLSINYPKVVPATLRKNINDIINDELQTLINCCICVSQQKLALPYLDFEFEKLLYSIRNDNTLLRVSVLIRLGYMTALGNHTNWQKPLGHVASKIITDFIDKTIMERAKNLFERVCQHDYNRDICVDLTALCIDLDESISLQKNYLFTKE